MKRFAAAAWCLIAALVLSAGIAGCTHHDADYSLNLEDVEVGGPGTAGLSVIGQPVRAIAVYFHGADQDARAIRESERHRTEFDSLLRSGVAVVAADAGGNAYGDKTSQEDYRRLIVAAKAKYGPVPLLFVAESMGALAALDLIREDVRHDVKGMVGICPLMGLPEEVRAVDFIKGAWDGNVPPEADPLTWSPDVFAGRTFRLYAATDDKVIPPIASARAFADRFGSVAKVDVVPCPGGHTDSACYRGLEIAEWFDALR